MEYSTDAAGRLSALLETVLNTPVMACAENIRRERTGVHAKTDLWLGEKWLGGTFGNVERDEDRLRFVNSTLRKLKSNEALHAALSGGSLKHHYDQFCLGLWDQHIGQSVPIWVAGASERKGLAFLLRPYLLAKGGSIFFGAPKSGKSYLLYVQAVALDAGLSMFWPVQAATRVLVVNLERDEESVRQRIGNINVVLGLARDRPLLMLNRKGGRLSDLEESLRYYVKDLGVGHVVLDSLSRAGAGSMVEDQVANRTMDTLNRICLSWSAVGHTARAGESEHVYGCHSADTDVLTEEGWKAHPTITLSDRVACYNPTRGDWQFTQPTAVHVYPHDGEMVHLNGKMVDILVTPGHRMLVKHRTSNKAGDNIFPREWTWATAAEVKRNVTLPAAAPLHAGEYPLCIDIDGASLESSAFMQYLGWWLSEGSIVSAGAVLTQAAGPLARRMLAVTRRLGFNPRLNIVHPKRREGYAKEKTIWHISTRYAPWFAHWLHAHCGKGARNKKIPLFVFRLAPHLRQILFDALMDGDGSWLKANPGAGTYSTTSLQLANDFQFLATTLGRATTLSQRRMGESLWSPAYVVNIRNAVNVGLTASRGGMQRLSYKGFVYCLTVPTGAYITRRNGKVIITGNSTMYDAAADMLVRVTSQQDGPDKPLGVGLQVMGANDTGRSGMEIMALDFDALGLTGIRRARIGEFPQVETGQTSRLPLHAQLEAILKAGAMDVNELAGIVGKSEEHVRKELNYYKAKFMVVSKQGKEQSWGLITPRAEGA